MVLTSFDSQYAKIPACDSTYSDILRQYVWHQQTTHGLGIFSGPILGALSDLVTAYPRSFVARDSKAEGIRRDQKGSEGHRQIE